MGCAPLFIPHTISAILVGNFFGERSTLPIGFVMSEMEHVIEFHGDGSQPFPRPIPAVQDVLAG